MMMIKRKDFLALILAGVLGACGGGEPAPTAQRDFLADGLSSESNESRRKRQIRKEMRDPQAVTIAILLPLSNPNKGVEHTARDLLDAAQLALFDSGRATGKPPIHLIVKDTRGNPQHARRVALQAIDDGAQLILGPLFGDSVQAITPLMRRARVPVLAFSNDRTKTAKGVWVLGFLPEENIEHVVIATIASGRTRFAALIPDTHYGTRIKDSFPNLVTRFGGELVRTEHYPAIAKEMFAPVRRLADYAARQGAVEDEKQRLLDKARALLPNASDPKRTFEMLGDIAPDLVAQYKALEKTDTFGEVPFDAVFIPDGGLALRNLTPLLPYFDVHPRNVKFIGTGLWDDTALGREPALQGGWFAAPDPTAWKRFERRFQTRYKRRPRRIATLAYDAFSFAFALVQLSPQRPFRTDALTNADGFRGVDGIFRLTKTGLNQRGLAVLEIHPRGNRVITPAPTSFVDYEHMRNGALLRANANNKKREAQKMDTQTTRDALLRRITRSRKSSINLSGDAIQQ